MTISNPAGVVMDPEKATQSPPARSTQTSINSLPLTHDSHEDVPTSTDPKSESSKPSSDSASASASDPGPPPDGGTTAWLQVLAGVFANALTWGYTTSFGVFQLYYAAHLGLAASDVAWIGSAQTFLCFFVGAASGRATDAGLTRHAVALGSFLLVFGIFMTSLATGYWQLFLAQGVCVGLGGGILFMPVLAVIGTYFSKNKAFAVGCSAGGTGVGGIIFPAIVQYLIPQIGYGWAVRCMAFISLVFAIIMNLILKPRLPPRRSGPLIEVKAFKEAPYTLYTVGMFLIFWALFIGFGYINLFARTRMGFSDLEAVNLLIIMNGIGIPSRMLVCWISDRYLGPINTMIPAAGLLGVMFFCWTAVQGRAGLYVFSVFYGLFASATQGLFASSLTSITDDLTRLGVRMGMVFTLCAFSSLTGNPIAGAIVAAQNGSFVGTQIWGGCVVVAGCTCLAAARIAKTGWTLRRKF